MLSSLREMRNNLVFHYREGNLNYQLIAYFAIVHLLAFGGLMRLPQCSSETLLWAFALWPIR